MRGAPQFHRWRASACWSIVLLVISAGLEVARSQDPSLEYAVKATYLHKFGSVCGMAERRRRVPRRQLHRCASSAMTRSARYLISCHRRTDRCRPSDRNPPPAIGLPGNPGCSVLYATGSQAQPVADILAVVRGMPISDGDRRRRQAGARGIINFVIADDRVRFEIDTHARLSTAWAISSKLLGLAVHVTGEGR